MNIQAFDSDKANQSGKEMEHEVFEGLRRALDLLKAQNTVVFSGLELKDVDRRNVIGEIDFLIISHQIKAVVQVLC